jgi:AcrR family transcriptional regulator
MDADIRPFEEPQKPSTKHRAQPVAPSKNHKKRMSALERREQLLEVARELFATKGFEALTVEEIALAAGVSKPIIYEHFGTSDSTTGAGAKESMYAVIVDREIANLLQTIEKSLDGPHPRILVEQAAMGFLTYIEENTEGFQILVRDSPIGMTSGSFSSLISDIAIRVQYLLAREFKARKFNPRLAPLYAQSLVGMVALTGQWWLETRKPSKEEVVAHLVNLAWNGLVALEVKPELKSKY